MRRVRFSAAVSLDGFIAGPNGEIDWIARDPDFDFASLYGQFDTALVGRKTYKEMAGGPSLPGLRMFVFSHTMRPTDCPDATVCKDATATIAEIRTQPGKDIWLFGGGTLFANLLDLGLVDSVELAVSPVLLGAGLPLRPGATESARLALSGQRVYPKSGIVALDYSVRP